VTTGDLSIEQHADGAVLVLALRGDLDIATAGTLPQAVARIDARRLVVDLRGVTVLDSTGVRALVHTRRWMVNHGGEARFVCADGPAARTLELMGLGDALGLVPDYASAVAAFAEVP
jgi:anti-anti-sigma factor